jgi:hypothetical protein
MEGRRGRFAAVALLMAAGVGLVAAGKASAAIYRASETFSAPDGQTSVGEDAECSDTAHVAISGGVSIGGVPADLAYLNTLFPPPDETPPDYPQSRWVGYVDNRAGGSASLSPIISAICDDAPKPGQYRVRSSGGTVPDATERGLTVSCKEKEIVLGGGVITGTTYADDANVSFNGPVDDRDRGKAPEDGWRAEVRNAQGGDAADELTVYAMCDRSRSLRKVSYRTDTIPAPDDTLTGLFRSCRPGETLLGGGVSTDAKYQHGVYTGGTFPATSLERWIGIVRNLPSPDGKSRKLKVTAICL